MKKLLLLLPFFITSSAFAMEARKALIMAQLNNTDTHALASDFVNQPTLNDALRRQLMFDYAQTIKLGVAEIVKKEPASQHDRVCTDIKNLAQYIALQATLQSNDPEMIMKKCQAGALYCDMESVHFADKNALEPREISPFISIFESAHARYAAKKDLIATHYLILQGLR